jgi:hypothetical protein
MGRSVGLDYVYTPCVICTNEMHSISVRTWVNVCVLDHLSKPSEPQASAVEITQSAAGLSRRYLNLWRFSTVHTHTLYCMQLMVLV